MTNRLLSPAVLGALTLSNHLVMAPMTRSRATGNVPNHLMAQYYAQRADAGLIITEAHFTLPDGLGYARPAPTTRSRSKRGKKSPVPRTRRVEIFVQLMHIGRIAHPQPAGRCPDRGPARQWSPAVVCGLTSRACSRTRSGTP